MGDVLVTRLLEYGPVGVLAAVVLILAWLGYKAERRLYDTEAVVKQIQEDKEEQDEAIKTVRGKAGKALDKIEDLNIKVVKFDGSLETVDTKLDNLSTGMGDIKRDVKSILDHFAKKGMDHA